MSGYKSGKADRVELVSTTPSPPNPQKAIPEKRDGSLCGKDWRPGPRKEDVSVEETWRSPLKPGKYCKNIILFSWFQQRPERMHPPQTRPTNLDHPK
ncbi:hypothetical protein [Paenibacillus sp. BR1-192]|uniref:hypothetical protein n=1 Tax=Paenibacillus sp. BR1-192 TaxID=3032287 RepID=UPI00240E52A9|nr:hypothetical protein [Paenibacillus sp. BR1-192]WFB57552.1 hypothetical protein P0X86_26880 [Paenibacillus sp. BR1-192]